MRIGRKQHEQIGELEAAMPTDLEVRFFEHFSQPAFIYQALEDAPTQLDVAGNKLFLRYVVVHRDDIVSGGRSAKR